MGDRCTEKVDMFSYGVILWELCAQERPSRGQLRALQCATHTPTGFPCCVAMRSDHCVLHWWFWSLVAALTSDAGHMSRLPVLSCELARMLA